LGHSKEWWGKGFAEEITRALIHKAMRDGLKCLVIECDPNQEASKKIALKAALVIAEDLTIWMFIG